METKTYGPNRTAFTEDLATIFESAERAQKFNDAIDLLIAESEWLQGYLYTGSFGRPNAPQYEEAPEDGTNAEFRDYYNRQQAAIKAIDLARTCAQNDSERVASDDWRIFGNHDDDA